MNIRYRLSTAVLGFLFIGMGTLPAFAQFEDAGQILRSGAQDANLLMREYLKPVGKGFGADLNSGWFSTAKVHALGGFDLTINASLALVPDTDRLFDVTELSFQEIEYISGGPETPTIAGTDEVGARIGSQDTFFNPNSGQVERYFEFDLPQGSGYPYVPAPMIQASVGLIKKTDVTLRYMPPLPLPNDVEFNLFGIGVKHEINQWLPGGKLLPVDLSLQAGFTNLSASVDFEVLPEVDNETDNEFSPETWEGQKGEFKTNAFTINAIVGKTLPFVSVFGGVGFQTSKVEISTPGSYPVTVPNENYDPFDPNSNPKKIAKVDDPINLEYKDNSSLHALVGARLKLLILNISASYTISKYPVAQVGVGFGIR